MDSKTILILGAGNAQRDAIEYCKSRGLTVAGCSYTNTDSGIPYLDLFRQVDIKNVEGVAEYAKEIGADAIYSIGSDLAVPTVMAASEALELPHFITPETAALCHSKHLMREALGRDFEGNADFIVCSTVEEALTFTDFPGMMKPVDSQGQRGCFRVDSAEDIKKNFAASLDYSVEGKVIIESFIDGPEISVNGYMVDGKLKFAMVSDRHAYDEFPGGIIKYHVVPSTVTSKETQDAAIDLTRRIVERLGINDGPCYCQIKVDSRTGKPVVLEITPRLDGCHMWNLIKHYCGVDLLAACFTQLLDGPEHLDEIFDKCEIPDKVYELRFMCMEPNVPFDRSGYDLDGAEYLFWYYENGENVHQVNGFMEKCGYIIRQIG